MDSAVQIEKGLGKGREHLWTSGEDAFLSVHLGTFSLGHIAARLGLSVPEVRRRAAKLRLVKTS